MQKLIPLLIVALLLFGSCKKTVQGCTDPTALNYNPNANNNDGSCIAKVTGCGNTYAANYDPSVNVTPWTGCTFHTTFYTQAQGAVINVTINGQSGLITTYDNSLTLPCDLVGAAHFNLPLGTYSYSALASSTGETWNGTITVVSNDCNPLLLTY